MKFTRNNRILSIVLSMVMVLGVISIGAGRILADTDTATGLEYSISEGKATIIGYSGTAANLAIPSKLGGYPVTGIVGSYYNGGAFADCTGLESVTIPDSVTNVGDFAFTACTGLVSVTIPGSVTSIGNGTFKYCTNLISITIPSSVKSIGYDAFKNSGLTSISIPSSVTSIDYSAFSSESLSQINIDKDNPAYSSLNGVLFDKSIHTLIQYPIGNTASTYTVPNGVTEIYAGPFGGAHGGNVFGAFMGNSSLTSVIIPNSVTEIAPATFFNCSSLTQINVDSNNLNYKSIDGVLFDYSMQSLIQYPIAKAASTYIIPNSVKYIGSGSFRGCTSLVSITIPNSVTEIGSEILSGWGYGAFANCTSLTAVTIPGSVAQFGMFAFSDCTSLTTATISTGITSIGDDMFAGCNNLTSVSIPAGVTYIGYHAFEDCSSLTSIILPESITTIDVGAFDFSGLTSVTIPNSVTNIGDQAFCWCSELTDAYFYGNAPTLGEAVFDECASDFTVNYLSTCTGYTNPWYGYNTVPFSTQGVSYQTHVQDIGWQDYVSNGATSGTSGQSKRLEAIRIKLAGIGGGIEYRTHVQDIGWMDWVADDALSGTSGQSKRLEAIQIRLTGTAAELYDVYYHVHAQNTGWLDWAKNGESAGTAGYGYRLEAIEIQLVPKGGAAPGATARSFVDLYAPKPIVDTVSYKTHVQDIGWQAYVSNGEMSGTSAQSKRLEAIQIKLENMAGGIEYRTHVQDYGWMNWVADDALSGTSGQSKRLEAIQIRLTGAALEKYDVYYCVHAENCGWLDWAKNGESAGTAAFGYRLEAIKVVLVPKGGAAPGATARAFVQG